ncbi:MAG: FprA family A-type flavoprotein [Chloroflexi bacterium]|nr:MAG: FprA family A-type flavoprotein [Chloroflexota bacterium]RLC91504.1 MAG: FprA family A-type flavoprotein [Chloroflexota bacterium]HEY68060.1 FprA family A-type flavoprotein [Thermoflexia bacterium]
MKPRKIKDGIYWVGAVDWDRRLFDDLIPLPDGTSYNAYLIRGSEKTALIDTVDPTMSHVLLDRLNQLNVERIDYVIANHAEQDHSGTLPQVLERYPEARVVCTPKCKGMLVDLLLAPEDRVLTVDDGATLSLGDRTLEFIHAPWVHWPETMLTYLREDRILFPCDFFGSHLATTDLYVSDEGRVYEAAKRYYAEIMMPFRRVIEKNLEKVQRYEISLIAPSHGPMYDRPEFILEAYRDWVLGDPKNIVVLPYISMHGTTRVMVNYLVDALVEKGVTVQQFNLAVTDIGELAMALVDAATIVIGSPTVLTGAHPNVIYAAYLANALRPKVKFVSIIGSYGWGGKMVQQLAGMISNLKVEVLEPVVVKGRPRDEDFAALDKLAATIAEKHETLK